MTTDERTSLPVEKSALVDVVPILARGLLQSPARCREFVAAFVEAETAATEVARLMAGIFMWLGEHNQDPDAAISLICDRCDLCWSRVSAGYTIQLKPSGHEIAYKTGTRGRIPFADLFDGRFESDGVREDSSHQSVTEDFRRFVDHEGGGVLWVTRYEFEGQHFVGMFFQCGLWNDCRRMLAAITGRFGVPIDSEYTPEFWGCRSRNEWCDAMNKKEAFTEELIAAVAGEIGDGEASPDVADHALRCRSWLLTQGVELTRARIESEVRRHMFRGLPRSREMYDVYAFQDDPEIQSSHGVTGTLANQIH
jgi:hypothetical protein